jgi:hypothetical protein
MRLMLVAPKKIGVIAPQRIRALPRMAQDFPENMNGETLVICLRIREDGSNAVRKGNSNYFSWKKDSFYTKSKGAIKFTYCQPILASIQSYVIEKYSSKDIDILKADWTQILNYIKFNLDEGVALWGDEYAPDYDKLAEEIANR